VPTSEIGISIYLTGLTNNYMAEIKTTTKLAAYKVELSNGTKIQIDVEEVDKVLKAVNAGSAVILKRGIIANPNFVVDIVPDYERITEVVNENKLNAHAIKQGERKPAGLLPLNDEFADLRGQLKLK